MKKFISVLIACLVLFSCTFSVFATNPIPQLVIESKEILVSDSELVVEFSLKNTDDISSIGIANITFDQSRFSLKSGIWSLPGAPAMVNDYAERNGTYIASAAYVSPINCNGKIFTLTLNVLEGAAIGESEISCEISAKNGSTKINVNVVDGAVILHNFNQKTDSPSTFKTAATCTQDEVYYYSCECGKIDTSNTWTKQGTATGHNLRHINSQTATCDEIGWNAYEYCTNCDYTTYQELSATGHNPSTADEVPPTCENAGTKAHSKCNDCGKIFINGIVVAPSDIIIPATGHKIVNHIAKAPTCTEIGWAAYKTCDNCDYTTYQEISATGHNLTHVAKVPARPGVTGVKEHDKCTACKKTFIGGNETTDLIIPALPVGWQKSGSRWWYAIDNGIGYAVGWESIGGVWYYFDTEGWMATGLTSVEGEKYYFDANGKMTTGWLQLNGKWYYFDKSGVMATGWQQSGGSWYYFNSSGAMTTGWLQSGGSWYYFSPSGAMLSGWQQLGGNWYYLRQI